MNKFTRNGRRSITIVATVTVAVGLSVLAAIMTLGNMHGNGEADRRACVDTPAAVAAIERHVTGEMAAFLTADAPRSHADLTFQAPEGRQISLGDFAGRTILVNLWATWCAPCRYEMPALDALQAELGGESFEVVAVNVDRGDRSKAQDFLDEIGVSNLAFYTDPTMGVFNTLRQRGRATGLPTTLLIDARGCELGVLLGPAEWNAPDAQALIQAAIRRDATGR